MKKMLLKIMTVMVYLTMLKLRAFDGQVTVRVIDENNVPMQNIAVNGAFEDATGRGWGETKINEANGITDTNGICILHGHGTDPAFSLGIKNSKMFYGATVGIEFTNAIDGRWQPWNPTVNIVLKKVGIQVPMYARRVEDLKIPVQGKPLGFDLVVGDWVAPYGKGQTSDFIFTLDKIDGSAVSIGPRKRQHRLIDASLSLSFSNDGDGIQQFFASEKQGLRSPRQASQDGYEATLLKREYETPVAFGIETNVQRHLAFRHDQNYFFRVRTKKDQNGNIISALYGKIYGDFNQKSNGAVSHGYLGFTYYLNPDPNSRNMEFDPKQNLFKNQSPLERVTAP